MDFAENKATDNAIPKQLQISNGKEADDCCKMDVRVLMIDTTPMRYDGITSVILNLISEIDRSNLSIDILAINDVEKSLRDRIESTGSRLFILKARNRKCTRYMKELTLLIMRNKYNVIHVHGNSCTMAIEMIAGMLGGAKSRCAHSHNTKCKHNTIHVLLKPIFDSLYTIALACGNDAGKWLFGKKDYFVIKNGIDTDRYRFSLKYRYEIRRMYGIEDKIVIGCVANFTQQKNHGFLIDVFEKVIKITPNCVLVLVGSGETKNDIENRVIAQKLEKKVLFLESREDIPHLLSSFDVMALPSLHEGLPCISIESQCSGLPLLASSTTTRECRLTNLVTFVPLKQECWIKALSETRIKDDRTKDSDNAIRTLKQNGYDASDQAQILKSIYEQSIMSM